MKNAFFLGLKTVLPIVLFIIILNWVIGVLFSGIEALVSLFPEKRIDTNLPDWLIKTLGIVLICIVVWLIGVISKLPKGTRWLKSFLNSIIDRIPLLSHLYSITNQVASSLRDTDSFKRVVLVKTFLDGYEVGFITGENPQGFCEALNEPELVSVVLPFSPLTSYRVLLVRPENIIETNVPVSIAISYIISMGSAGAANQIMKESCSEWRMRLFLSKKIYGCFL